MSNILAHIWTTTLPSLSAQAMSHCVAFLTDEMRQILSHIGLNGHTLCTELVLTCGQLSADRCSICPVVHHPEAGL